MYQYVLKNELRPYREKCSGLLNQLLKRLSKEVGTVEVRLIGSGASKLVVEDGRGPFDLDYNLYFTNLPEQWASQPGKLKNYVRETMDTLCPKDFSCGKDSTSCITYLVYKGKNVCFHMDLGILIKNDSGNSRLIHDKDQNVYIWNLVKGSERLSEKAKYIHYAKEWNLLRAVYLSKKNQNLLAGIKQPSFETYAEVVNDLYNRLKQKEQSNV